MLAWRTGDTEVLAADQLLNCLPGLEADDAGPRSQVLGTVRSGEDAAAVKELSAQGVEVVDMVFVAKEHSIDGREVVKLERGTLEAAKR